MKTRLTRDEIEHVRISMLRLMLSAGMTAEAAARRSPYLKADSLRKFLQGTRPSQRMAALLVERFPELGLTYRSPAIVSRAEVALSTAS